MTNILKIDLTSLEIGEDETLIDSKNNNRYFEYNEAFKTELILAPNTNYKTITYSEVSSPFMLVVVSDKNLNVKINDEEFTNTKFVVLNTQISSLQVANVDLTAAKIKIYIWGKQ